MAIVGAVVVITQVFSNFNDNLFYFSAVMLLIGGILYGVALGTQPPPSEQPEQTNIDDFEADSTDKLPKE
jgi:hypothetical protein